jgi:hypothetical protein
MKLTTDFQLQELVHKAIYTRIGNRCADFLNPMLAPTCQALRDEFGSIIINDYMWGGKFTDSGLREPHGIIGARFSAHKFGNAADLKFKTMTPIEVQSMIMEDPSKFPYITRMENAEITKTWLHIETSVRRNSPIKIFNP